MTPEVIELLRANNKLETKTLMAKGVKAGEELGEMCAEILAYTETAGSQYKESSKDKVAEEALDLIIIALSIVDDLGYNDEQIAAVMTKKLNKWKRIVETGKP